MIKIEIPKLQDVKTDYLTALRNPVKNRIEPLIISLQHLNGGVIDVTQGNFERYKKVTQKIVNRFTDGNSLGEEKFDQPEYSTTVANFISNSNKTKDYTSMNLNGLIQFLEFLIYPNTDELDRLLICDPNNLMTKNLDFYSTYSINGDANKFILTRAFNYKEFDTDISKFIRSFFRTRNFVKFCPYCNLTEVEFISNEGGLGSATSHELDHFFDKASFPLLSYSFFNLVPSDSTCNGSGNKGTKLFTDTYHSNPHSEGFKRKMVFKPIMQGTKVISIAIDVRALSTEPIYYKMLGSRAVIDETFEEGNINVFSIHSKYRTRTVKAEKVLNKVYKSDKGRKATIKLFRHMVGLNNVNHYKSWYEREIDTFFDSEKFHEYAYSKFNRDIHDFYYANDQSIRNNFIRALIG